MKFLAINITYVIIEEKQMNETAGETLKIITEYHAEEILDVTAEVNLFAEVNKRVKRYRRLYGSFCIVLGVICIVVEEFASWNDLLFLVGIIGIAVGVVQIMMSSSRRMQKRIRKQLVENAEPSVYSGRKEFEFSDSGVTSTSTDRTSHYDWNAVRAWNTCRNYIYLTTNDGRISLMDTNQMSSDERSRLEQILSDRVRRAPI